ncbi:hypothetical protein C5167_005003 [Papaver somniferum]|uniref:TPX2 central domain-containing protein n=1 Tax=Papaver somniferum TaxID=3469 RepID=A0A4Y7JDH4_PAPSO|nr:uncharacterized protein LOC113275075 isoform X1 [Papaver somniferum]RZC57695.1 hypothetical protein C5167_005003 [Papaver somniferum]
MEDEEMGETEMFVVVEEEEEDEEYDGRNAVEVKIDLDYEYDATKYFDFSREETEFEAANAEMWFDRAGDYPPSPFVAKLRLGLDMGRDSASTCSRHEDMDEESTSTHSDMDMAPEIELSVLDERCRGLTFYNHMEKDITKAKLKSGNKKSFPRSSTLMKPTASQLAKQNQFVNRFQKPLLPNSDRSTDSVSIIGTQAPKRQKLEGGHLHKVAETKQQHSLTHKAPKKDGPVSNISTHAKMKITIPREPELETAHRARRLRSKNGTDLREEPKPTIHQFKALPLNRKILEAPTLALRKKSTPKLPQFQVFHLKTSERATQHTSAASASSPPCDKTVKVVHKFNASSTVQNGTTDSKRPSIVDIPRQEASEITNKFKARPLNRKIFSSKGDIGVFRNTKREPTIPMEFNFPTDKRFNHIPPVDLFDKLSLTTESRQNAVPQPRLPRPARIPTGSKENAVGSLQQGNMTIQTVKDKAQIFGVKQNQCGGDLESGIGTRANMSRTLDIR